MLFSDRPRHHYRNPPVHEVICQLRFPTILSINTAEPADFQEAIRDTFPQYLRRQDTPAPKLTGIGGPNPQVERQLPVTNHHFLSADSQWKLNLTKDFIALSTLHYPGWEDFAAHLDKPLAAFIQLYKPAYFLRIGLRYVNLFSRTRLGLEACPWTELIAPAYTGPLREPDIREEDVLNCGCDVAVKLSSSCQAKIRAGLGRVQTQAPNAPQDPEIKFILDMDLSMSGNTPCTMAAGALETLHIYGGRVFEGAVSDRLRDALGPL